MNSVAPSPKTASISSSGIPIVSGYTFVGYQICDLSRKKTMLTEINDNKTAHAEKSMHGVQPPLDNLL